MELHATSSDTTRAHEADPVELNADDHTAAEAPPGDALRPSEKQPDDSTKTFDPPTSGGGTTEAGGTPSNIATTTHIEESDDRQTAPVADKTDADASTDLYTVTIPEVRIRLNKALLFRKERTLQRYCEKGILACKKVTYPGGSQWLTTDESVERYIDNTPIDHEPPGGDDTPAEAAPGDDSPALLSEPAQSKAETSDAAKQRTPADMHERFIEHLTEENSHLRNHVDNLTRRLEEQNLLANSLQNLVLQLTGKAEPKPVHEAVVKSTGAEQPAEQGML